MADLFGTGLSNTSMLSGENAATARMIQDSFTRSKLARDRQGLRYGLPALSSFNQDNALAQAQTTAGILNNNQQLQKMLDEANRSPHGFMENMNAYLPAISGLLKAYPALFGTSNSLTKDGLLGSAYKGITSWFKDPNTGQTYGMDGAGKVVTAYDTEGNVIPGYGMYDRGLGGMGDYTAQTGMLNYGQFDRGIGSDWSASDWGNNFSGGFGPADDWASWGNSVTTDWGDWGSVVGDLYGGL